MNSEEARALVERQARAWKRADPAAIIADFAPDGALISPRGHWRGHDALRRAAEVARSGLAWKGNCCPSSSRTCSPSSTRPPTLSHSPIASESSGSS
jgi:uncharacterized protein (TIGR02246 family)